MDQKVGLLKMELCSNFLAVKAMDGLNSIYLVVFFMLKHWDYRKLFISYFIFLTVTSESLI